MAISHRGRGSALFRLHRYRIPYTIDLDGLELCRGHRTFLSSTLPSLKCVWKLPILAPLVVAPSHIVQLFYGSMPTGGGRTCVRLTRIPIGRYELKWLNYCAIVNCFYNSFEFMKGGEEWNQKRPISFLPLQIRGEGFCGKLDCSDSQKKSIKICSQTKARANPCKGRPLRMDSAFT